MVPLVSKVNKNAASAWIPHSLVRFFFLTIFGTVCYQMGTLSPSANSNSLHSSTTSVPQIGASSSIKVNEKTHIHQGPDVSAPAPVVANSGTYAAILPCEPIDESSFTKRLQCFEKCKADSTLEKKRNLDDAQLNMKINMTVRAPWKSWTREYGRHRIFFPEEDVHMLMDRINDGNHDYRPRAYTERLFRRIIAKLFRTGVLNPQGNIVNIGSWIGDNAVPWALMLEKLSPTNPGHVYTADPSKNSIKWIAELTRLNDIRNLCLQVAVFSSQEGTVYARGDINHLTISGTDPGRNSYPLPAIPLDSWNLTDVALLHLDVEGHEAELLRGATELLKTNRPLIVTEGKAGWPPRDPQGKDVADILFKAGYLSTTDEIPEICGWNRNDRNRIWWPDEATRDAAMAVIGRDLARRVEDWVSFDLPMV